MHLRSNLVQIAIEYIIFALFKLIRKHQILAWREETISAGTFSCTHHFYKSAPSKTGTCPQLVYLSLSLPPAPRRQQVTSPLLHPHPWLGCGVFAAHAEMESDERADSGLFTWLRLKMTFWQLVDTLPHTGLNSLAKLTGWLKLHYTWRDSGERFVCACKCVCERNRESLWEVRATAVITSRGQVRTHSHARSPTIIN